MFNLNFISKPGIQEDTSDESWSYIYMRSKTENTNQLNSRNCSFESSTLKTYEKNICCHVTFKAVETIRKVH